MEQSIFMTKLKGTVQHFKNLQNRPLLCTIYYIFSVYILNKKFIYSFIICIKQ